MMRLVLLLVCSCALLPTAELVVRDLRLGLGMRSTDFDFTVDGATVGESGGDAFDRGWALEGGGRWSFTRTGSDLGMVVGADLIREELVYGDGGLGTTWLRACIGGGWAPTDRWTLVAMLGAQLGRSVFEDDGDARQHASTRTGNAVGYDLRVEATWQVTRRIGIGMHAGWLKAAHDITDGQLDATIDRSGWILGLQAVWRFTNAPTRLE